MSETAGARRTGRGGRAGWLERRTGLGDRAGWLEREVRIERPGAGPQGSTAGRRDFLKAGVLALGGLAAGAAGAWAGGFRAVVGAAENARRSGGIHPRPVFSGEEPNMSIRPIKSVVESQPTVEGAGVRLRRAFGFNEKNEYDPFLLFDDFRNEIPRDYAAGFPWHPHRGIETITYVLAGQVEHQDSLGNRGALGSGDVQWMTAGSGILHQEMPQGDSRGRMHGFQLWANLPSSLKMTEPRYQDIPSSVIPEVTDDDGTKVRVICGSFWGKAGPVDGIAAEPRYLDVWVPPGLRKVLPVDTRQNAFAYVFDGSGSFRDASEPREVLTENAVPNSGPDRIRNRSLVLFDSGDAVSVQAGEEGVRFLLVSGKAIREPVAWRGPIVMNTNEELQRAWAELQSGTFIKHK